MANKQEDKLSEIALLLQSTGHTFPDYGLTAQEISEATGLARSTVYRLIDGNLASRWGIRQGKKRQPYTYYVDNAELIAYQIYYSEHTQPPNTKVNFGDDKDRQRLYEMLNSFIQQAVGQFKEPRVIHEQFITQASRPTEEIISVLTDETRPRTSKLAAALILVYQNLEG